MDTPTAGPSRLALLLIYAILSGCAASRSASPRVVLDDTATSPHEMARPESTHHSSDDDAPVAPPHFYLDPATLETTPEHKRNWTRNLHHATLAVAISQTVIVTAMTRMPSAVTGWTGRDPGIMNIGRSFSLGPRFDDDLWYWNSIAHPIAGAEYYLLARNRGAAGWQALIYAASLSAFWEFGPEAMYERASIQDLIITPIGGAILGECRYQGRKALIDPQTGKANTTWKRVLVIMLDPIEALTQ